MATQSMPTVSCLSIRNAIFSFVPTPSAPLTRTGRVIPVVSSSNSPLKPPMLAPDHYAPWVAQRGPIARPLLWSHAKYLLARHALQTG